MKWGLALACTWEVVAITTGRVPTFTELSQRNRWLAPAILLTLAVHLYRQPRLRPVIVTVAADNLPEALL